MKEINFDELAQIKILPFDINDDTGYKLIKAGEILTPGKLLSLKNKKIYKTSPIENSNKNILVNEEYFVFNNEDRKRIINSFLILVDKVKSNDELETQKYTIALTNEIYSIIIENFKKADYLSQFRILGDYKIVHSINCTIFCCLVALKQGLSDRSISYLMQASLLHDIAKILTNDFKSYKTKKNHSIAACKILGKLGFEYEVLNLILNHHENLDGTGYPQNRYYNSIPKEAMIINICSYFDNLFKLDEIKTYKDAFKTMLSIQHSKFSLDILYSLINSYNYGDIKNFEGIYE